MANPSRSTTNVVSVGAYAVQPDRDRGWYVMYVEDHESVEDWDRLLDAVPGLRRAKIDDVSYIHVNNHLVIAQYWKKI